MLSHFINIQYCYTLLIDQISFGLLLYSHVPTALFALLFGGYVFLKTKNIPSTALFIVCLTFAVWCFLDLTSWFTFFGSVSVMYAWSLLDMIGLLMFFFSYYFLYSFITRTDLPNWQKIVGIAILLPTFIWTFFGSNLALYDANVCAAIENDLVARYPYFVEAIFIIVSLLFVVVQYKKTSSRDSKKEILLVGGGVTAFLAFFFSSTFLVNLLATSDSSLYVYNYEIYGLFGMPILLGFLGYVVVRYKAFNLKVFGAQALILTLVGIIGSQFFFIQGLTNNILNGVTLLLAVIFGVILIKSVKKEIESREKIEKLADELGVSNAKLQEANDGQATLMHFMNHQIKGKLGIAKNVFAELLGTDYGVMPPEAKPLLEKGRDEVDAGVRYVTGILDAESARTGQLPYKMNPCDFKTVMEEVAIKQREYAQHKGLAFTVHIDDADYMMNGDATQLGEAIKNMIDNSVNYTPTGSIELGLSQHNGTLRFVVKDTGVGIDPEDRPKLFKSGGRGANSVKINTNSTGYGLVFVKGVVEAHKGRVWAESAGPGTGSTFIMEIPTINK